MLEHEQHFDYIVSRRRPARITTNLHDSGSGLHHINIVLIKYPNLTRLTGTTYPLPLHQPKLNSMSVW